MTTSELYRKHTSGTVSREKFLYEVRRDNNLPWILNTTSYGDAVKILKNKRIIFENNNHSEKDHEALLNTILKHVKDPKEAEMYASNPNSMPSWLKSRVQGRDMPVSDYSARRQADDKGYYGMKEDLNSNAEALPTIIKAIKRYDGNVILTLSNGGEAALSGGELEGIYGGDSNDLDSYIGKKWDQEDGNEDDYDYEDDYDDEGDYDYEEPGDDFDMAGGLYENAEGVYGHVPNGELPKVDYDRINYHQLMKGMDFELAKMGGISDENLVKAKKKALDNIVKDSNHYRDLIVTNFDKIKKEDATRKMEPVKADNLVDKANGMKVIKKDAPAASDKVKKAISKKISVQVMTQTPKKVSGVAVMEVPKQEKVIALKESILKEFKEQPLAAEHFGVGARVRTKDGKKKGEITEFDGDTATVKLDNGVIEHIQANILTKREVPVKEDAEHADWNNISKEDAERLVDYNERTGRLPYDVTPEIFDKICDKYKLGFNKEPDTQLSESDDNYDEPTDRKVYFHGQAADADKYKIKKDSTGRVVQATNSEGHTFSKNDKAIAAKDPSGPEQEIKITGFIEDQGKVKAIYSSSAQHGQFAQQIDIDGLSPVGGGMRPGVDMGKSFEKYKALKEKLLKAVKETIKVNPKTHQAVATGGSSDDATAGRLGFTQTLPGNITPLGKTQ